MRYESTLTSKGTITIAAPVRKKLNLKPGQKIYLDIDDHGKISIAPSISMAEFKKIRNNILKNAPRDRRIFSAEQLQKARTLAWTENYRD